MIDTDILLWSNEVNFAGLSSAFKKEKKKVTFLRTQVDAQSRSCWQALESCQNTKLSKVMLHSVHAHWTKGNLIRSTGEIDPEPEFALLQTTLNFSSSL